MKQYFAVHSYLYVAIVLYFDFDGVDEVGAFIFGLYGFGGKFGFAGDVGYFSFVGVLPAFCGIGVDGNGLS